MTTLLGSIADDFTGATDLAGLLARSGVKVSLRMGVPNEAPTDTAAFEVIALKCRTAPVDEAVAEVRSALKWLQQAGAERFFWKYCSTFDSTAQGNIGPVAEALMADVGAKQTIYCPAFPENGRSIFMGNLFVGEQPLSESPMKDHPLTPMRDSNLMRLLVPQVTKPVGLANRLTVAKGTDALKARLNELAEAALAELAVAARVLGARRFVITGGETSGAVTQALGVNKLDVSVEITPGVPWSFCVSDAKAIALALKSGNFGAENFFADALVKLKELESQ